MNVMVVVTHDLGGHMMGRKRVLLSMLAAMRSLGHRVEVLMFASRRRTRRPSGDWAARLDVHVERLATPGALRLVWNVVTRPRFSGYSLNECLFHSPRARRTVQTSIQRFRPDVLVSDTLRTASLVAGQGIPWILNLGDALSERYEQMHEEGSPTDMILGYHRELVPGLLRSPVTRVASRLLAWEARRMAEREAMWAGAAGAVCVVSAHEARRLSERVGREVYAIGMSVEETTAKVAERDRVASPVFLGGMDIQGNVDAVRFYVEVLAPTFVRQGTPAPLLTVVGRCPDRVRAELAGAPVMLRGYVDDAAAALARHRMFVAPMVSRTGIKTKILDALAMGLPTLTTRAGVTGLDLEPGVHLFVADEPEEFVRRYRAMEADPGACARVAAAGRAWVLERFAPSAARARWARLLSQVRPTASIVENAIH
jgi:glycosyl transferase family 1